VADRYWITKRVACLTKLRQVCMVLLALRFAACGMWRRKASRVGRGRQQEFIGDILD
jgi:hypothetical protein